LGLKLPKGRKVPVSFWLGQILFWERFKGIGSLGNLGVKPFRVDQGI